MPWRNRVKGIVQAWYPGQAGGQAIAELLTGADQSVGTAPDHVSGPIWPRRRGPEIAGARYTLGNGNHDRVPRRGRGRPPLVREDSGYAPLRFRSRSQLYPFHLLRPRGHRRRDAHRQLLRHQYRRPLWGRRTAAVPDPCRGRTTDAASRLSKGRAPAGGVTTGDHCCRLRLLARFDGRTGQWHVTAGSHSVALGAAADSIAATANTVLSGRPGS